MNQSQVQTQLSNEQQIQQILVYAKTFRKHPLILFGKKQISPYDLACNGFVNKNFKEQQKEENKNQQQFKQLTCICRVPGCQKTLRFNDKIQTQANDQQIENLLTQHEENCDFNGHQFKRLSVNQLFQISDLMFDKILQSYKKEGEKITEGIGISWQFIEKMFLNSQETKKPFSMLLQCYKNLDHKFSISTKRFDKTKLVSLFGWKLNSLVQNNSFSMKCHYCGKKLLKNLGNHQIDPLQEHNNWCLMRDKSYQMWRLILKKKFIKDEKKRISQQVDSKTKQTIIPKRKSEIRQKQIREEVFEIARPALQKIDQLLQKSIQTVKKQRHLNESNKQKLKQQNEQNEIESHLEVYLALDQIGTKAKQIIKDFINSIRTSQTI